MIKEDIDFSSLPIPPESLLAIIRYCSEDETNAEHLAGLIKVEPVLTAEMLKIVNSSYYGLVSEITSVERLTGMMGLKTIRSLALCLAIRDVSNNKPIEGFDEKLYWEDSIRRAAISSRLGKQLGFDKDECFTAGLLQDIGLLVLFSQENKSQEFIRNYRHYNPDLRVLFEKEEFSVTHNEVASFLQTHWALPEIFVNAIREHHHQKETEVNLNTILYCTDWLNALFTLPDKENVFQQCFELLQAQLKLGERQVRQLIEELPTEIARLSEGLGHKIAVENDLDELLELGAKKLAEQNIELQEVTWRLRKAIKERDAYSEQLERETEVAKEVQRALLPANEDAIPIHAFNLAAKELSGDFYDYFETPDKKVYFCLGDVSGKGVYASLLMVKASTLFRTLSRDDSGLSKIAAEINQELCRVAVRGMFVTMVIGLYDPVQGEVLFVSAGHLPVLYLDNEGISTTFETQAPPFGIVPDQTFEEDCLSIKGGSIYLYSDGVSESKLNTNTMLGIEGLTAILQKLNGMPAQKRLQLISEKLQKNQTELHDDTTMLVLEGAC